MPRNVSRDQDLSPRNYRAVNATFYSAEPADYFHRRLLNLVLVVGNREALDRLLNEGVNYREFSVGTRSDADESMERRETPTGENEGAADASGQGGPAASRHTDKSEDKAAQTAQHFVTAEAEVLAHHVGETLLRLYLSHEFRGNTPAPPSPALDLSRLRSFSEFKDRVRGRFGENSDPADRENLDAVARVFHATEIRENLLPTPVSSSPLGVSLRIFEAPGWRGNVLRLPTKKLPW